MYVNSCTYNMYELFCMYVCVYVNVKYMYEITIKPITQEGQLRQSDAITLSKVAQLVNGGAGISVQIC